MRICPRIIVIGCIGLWWAAGVSLGLLADDGPIFVPPAPPAEPAPLPLPDAPVPRPDLEYTQAGRLTQDELDLIHKPPQRLKFPSASEVVIRREPAVPVDPDSPELGLIQPPPMQQNRFDVENRPQTLHVPSLAVESPFYRPVAPFSYGPLYFEEPYLERYGDRWCHPWQSVLSGTLFYSRIPLLPLKMLREPPWRPVMPIWPDAVDPAWEYGR